MAEAGNQQTATCDACGMTLDLHDGTLCAAVLAGAAPRPPWFRPADDPTGDGKPWGRPAAGQDTADRREPWRYPCYCGDTPRCDDDTACDRYADLGAHLDRDGDETVWRDKLAEALAVWCGYVPESSTAHTWFRPAAEALLPVLREAQAAVLLTTADADLRSDESMRSHLRARAAALAGGDQAGGGQ